MLLSLIVAALTLAEPTWCRPQRQLTRGFSPSSRSPDSSRRNNNDQRRLERPNRRLPGRSAPSLFVRPEFDVFGNPITFDIIIPENEELPDFKRRRPAPKTNLGPDLKPRLPVFGQPDAILKATEELRNRDVNQESIVPLVAVNAGKLQTKTLNANAFNTNIFIQ